MIIRYKKHELYAHYNLKLIISNNTNISTVPGRRLQTLRSSQRMPKESYP